MPKDKVVRRPHPRPAAPGVPSPTGEGYARAEFPGQREDLVDERHTTPPNLWRRLHPEARRMRGAPTSAEEVLWQALRDASLGTRFRRQHVIDRFIVDFCSLRERLIVEVDGGVHDAQQERDAERDTRLRAV
ncbi:MAG TPA: DUF559 domain-containing protein, partial [bacterium]